MRGVVDRWRDAWRGDGWEMAAAANLSLSATVRQ
jgi:hypothetical protein